MAKSRGRKFAEITSPTSGVFDLTSVPTITNAKLQNSAMTLAGSSVSLGGTGVADTDALSEGSSNLYFTNARVQTFLGGGTLAGNIVVPDNRSIYLGSSSDFRLYHDTTDTQLVNATGILKIISNGGVAVTGAATFSSTIAATGATFTGDSAITKETPVFTLTDSSASRTLALIVDDNNSVVRASGTLLLQAGGSTNALAFDTSRNATFSGNMFIPDGSVSSPAIGFANDTDTGILRVTTNALGITAGGSRKFYVNATNAYFQNLSKVQIDSGDFYVDGNVGIGVSSPSAPLDVVTNSTVWAGEFTQSNTSNGDGVIVTVGSTAAADYALSIRSDGGNTGAFNVKANGNVGIGEFSPLSLLHIKGTGDAIRVESTNTGAGGAQMDLLHFTTSPADNDVHGSINFGGYTSGTSSAYGSAIRSIWSDVSAKEAKLNFYTRDDSDFTARMTIDKDGNVGIGTESPSTNYNKQLHVHASGTGASVHITDNNSGSGNGDGFELISHNNSAYVWQRESGNLLFGTSAQERMRIDANGNVGIGTDTPEHHLHVTEPGSTDEDGIVKIGGSAASLGLELRYNQAGVTQTDIISNPTYTNANALMKICVDGDANANQLVLKGNGNVGIGTDSPAALLHLKSTAASTGPSLIFENTNNAQAMNIDYYNNSGSVQSRIRYSEGPGSFEIMPNSSANAAMIFLYNGKVGVGTTNPQVRFDVHNNSSSEKTARFVNTGSSTQGITIGTTTADNSGRGIHIGHTNSGGLGFVHSYNYGSGAWDTTEIRGANVNLNDSNGYTIFRAIPNAWSLGGGTTSHGRVRSYHYAVALSAGASVALLTNNSGAHTDVNFLYWIEAYHSGRTYRTGVGTFGGYGLYTSSAGTGLNFTITAVSSGVKRLDFVASSSYATTVYIGMMIFGDTALTVHNGTLADMI